MTENLRNTIKNPHKYQGIVTDAKHMTNEHLDVLLDTSIRAHEGFNQALSPRNKDIGTRGDADVAYEVAHAIKPEIDALAIAQKHPHALSRLAKKAVRADLEK